jgi:hypothetical protein
MRSLILALTLAASAAFAPAAFADCGPKHTSSLDTQQTIQAPSTTQTG